MEIGRIKAYNLKKFCLIPINFHQIENWDKFLFFVKFFEYSKIFQNKRYFKVFLLIQVMVGHAVL